MTGGKYINEPSALQGSSFSVEYCNFITGEQDYNEEDSNKVEENEEADYLSQLVNVIAEEDDIVTEDDDVDYGVNEGNKDLKSLSDKQITNLSYKLISFPTLKDAASNLACGLCAKDRKYSKISTSQKTCGIATDITFQCELNAKHQFKCNADTSTNVISGSDTKLGKYTLNVLAVLLMFYSGIGFVGLSRIFGLLGIAKNATSSHRSWKKLQDKIGDLLKEKSDECIAKNLEEEIQETKKRETEEEKGGRTGITISIDMGWQKRGKQMNSLSGHMFALGGYLKRIVGRCVYAKTCHTCTNAEKKKKKDPRIHKCPKNYV